LNRHIDASTYLTNAKLANTTFFSLHRPIAIENDPDLFEQVQSFQQEQAVRAEALLKNNHTLPPLFPTLTPTPTELAIMASPSQVDKDAAVTNFFKQLEALENEEIPEGYQLDSVLRKRKKKMNKHKQRKRRKLNRGKK
jgi:hypothetical protein